MNKRNRGSSVCMLFCFIGLYTWGLLQAQPAASYERPVGITIYNSSKVYEGVTLFAPMDGDGAVVLIDMSGRILHSWKMPFPPGEYGYLLPTGHLLYAGKAPTGPTGMFPEFEVWRGGRILEVDWEGKVVWDYENLYQHHDFRRMRNGNTLVLCSEKIPRPIAAQVKGGVSGSEYNGDMWADYILEVTPQKEAAWEWHAYEHLDLKEDIIGPFESRAEWTHGNAVSELPGGNILVSFRTISTVGIIDKKTGKFVWKWGKGQLAQQHDPTMLENGHILIFDNGTHRSGEHLTYSRVIEVDPKTGNIVWEYRDKPQYYFYSHVISGAQRLPQGNTLITEGVFGRIFEVTHDGEIVWEYINPFFTVNERFGKNNWVFRAYRYSRDQVPGLRRNVP